MDDVEELEEDRGEAAIRAVPKVASLVEPVTKGEPLLFYQGAEPFQSPVVGARRTERAEREDNLRSECVRAIRNNIQSEIV